MTDTAETFITAQREALTTKRIEVQKTLSTVQAELDGIDRELQAILAYETAREPNYQKTREKNKRSSVLELLANNGSLTRADIIEKRGVKGDKAGEQSISNILRVLKLQKKITQDADGKYAVAQLP